MDLRTMIRLTLVQQQSRCLDDPTDFAVVAKALEKALHLEIDKHICNACGHLDEVHQECGTDPGECPGFCLGGPDTHCDCQGFNTHEG